MVKKFSLNADAFFVKRFQIAVIASSVAAGVVVALVGYFLFF